MLAKSKKKEKPEDVLKRIISVAEILAKADSTIVEKTHD